MSLRLLTTRLTKHGRLLLQNLWSREIHINILEQKQNRTLQTRLPKAATNVLRSNVATSTVARNALQAVVNSSPSSTSVSSAATGIFRFGQHARKIFVDNILNRVTSTYSGELRQQATKKLFYGDSAPFFALIGVSLASGAGVLTKEDELEGVCWEIREAASRLQNSWNYNEAAPALEADFNVDHLDIGAPIAKGCAAVVYAASLKQQGNTDIKAENLNDNLTAAAFATNTTEPRDMPSPRQPIVMTPIQNISRFVHNFGTSVDNLNIYNQRSATFSPRVEEYLVKHENETKSDEEAQLKHAVETLKMEDKDFKRLDDPIPTANSSSIERYPLALKMMFNYDIQSNAISILRAMYKETVPARQRHMNPATSGWERYLQEQTLTLPAHPFIVNMLGFFCDEVRNFPSGHVLYPSAQPQRINPNGYGRNMSLFLLMKRYDFNLRALLDSNELQARTKLLLFAQLLEAVAHLNRHGIAHRDLKSDNILIELNDDSHPVLVLSDFGCCLADKVHGLQIPYTSQDMDKGGNAALMAPEIINKQPGPFSVLNYAKADLWACGAIAYEIFGLPNPFYASNLRNFDNGAGGDFQRFAIRNENYKINDLPPLNSDCPVLVQKLIFNILNPNPSKRVSPDIAANILQLFLWAPSKWLKSGGMPNSTEVLQWLLSLTTKLMCEGRAATVNTAAFPRPYNLFYNQSGRRTYVEYLLICSFLTRARLRRIRGAISWIQDSV